MEPSGTENGQNGDLQLSQSQTRRLRNVEQLDGKEGVNGSSPLEGFTKLLLFSSFSSRTRRRLGAPASTERPPLAATAFCGAWNRCC